LQDFRLAIYDGAQPGATTMSIASEIRGILKIPTRLKNVIPAYLTSLMTEAHTHTLTHAAKLCGLAISQFSRLLSGHKELALEHLNRVARRRLKKVVGKRRQLVPGAIWKIAIIIDATLHTRSSRHIENSQRFNHGDGWVIGHQWTNIVILINNEIIPLPPIPFHTKKYCKENGLTYQPEHDRVIDFLATAIWADLLPGVDPREIAVLMDSGYDNKELETFIQLQGWSFVVSLKTSRTVQTATQGLQNVVSLFKVTRKIGLWKTVRMIGGTKRKEFRVRTLSAFLKGVPFEVEIACSEKPNGKRIYLACSLKGASAAVISRTYKLRWRVEIFHKEVKSYLGFEDVGVMRFDAVEAHVYWVYTAYLLLFELLESDDKSILARRQNVEARIKNEEVGRLLKLNSRIDGRAAVRKHYALVRQRLDAAS
jgi:hypothetical protein